MQDESFDLWSELKHVSRQLQIWHTIGLIALIGWALTVVCLWLK